MDLSSYPRPGGDTGIGFHWFPDMQHYDKSYLKRFGPELKAMGASWLALMCGLDAPVPESFIQGLSDRGIEPVLRLHTPFVGAVDLKALDSVARACSGMGVRYMFIYNAPNMRGEWAKFPELDAPQQFMELALPALETLAAIENVVPVFSPLAQGGDFDDLEFLDQCLEIVAARGSEALRDKLAVGIQSYPQNKPLMWGHGGSEAWPATQAGECPEGSEDPLGFCVHEWYQEIARAHLGRWALMIATESGPRLGAHSHPGFPVLDEALHAQRAAGMAQAMMDNQVPLYLANVAFSLLAAEDGDPFAADRWYRQDGIPVLPKSVDALKKLPKHARTVIHVPGRLDVLGADGEVINMDLEEYLMGVVPCEMPASGPSEALKAQAIAARTFAARAIQSPRHGKIPVCTQSHCQNWATHRDPRSDQAVGETEKAVLTFNDDFIGAYYFAHCDGHTRNSEDVWHAALPYCRSVPCICGNTKMYGHGVGMCQEGAIRMAQQGALADEILQHYYTGARVVRQGDTANLE
jgi:hypothetical protein